LDKYWKKNDDMIKENLLERKEVNKKDEAESDRASIEKEIRKEDENEEKSLIREEHMDEEVEEDAFGMCQADEETEDYSKENHVQDNKEMEKVSMKQQLQKKIVFKVEREAVSRVKEKPD